MVVPVGAAVLRARGVALGVVRVVRLGQQVEQVEEDDVGVTVQERRPLEPVVKGTRPVGHAGSGVLGETGRPRHQDEQLLRVGVHGVADGQIVRLVLSELGVVHDVAGGVVILANDHVMTSEQGVAERRRLHEDGPVAVRLDVVGLGTVDPVRVDRAVRGDDPGVAVAAGVVVVPEADVRAALGVVGGQDAPQAAVADHVASGGVVQEHHVLPRQRALPHQQVVRHLQGGGFAVLPSRDLQVVASRPMIDVAHRLVLRGDHGPGAVAELEDQRVRLSGVLAGDVHPVLVVDVLDGLDLVVRDHGPGGGDGQEQQEGERPGTVQLHRILSLASDRCPAGAVHAQVAGGRDYSTECGRCHSGPIRAPPGDPATEGAMRPVPILYCIDALHGGGTELQLLGLLERLDRRRFRPLLCTLRPSSLDPGERVAEHLVLPTPRLLSPCGWRSVRRLAAWLRERRVAVVQTFFQDATVVGLAAARRAGVPVRLVSFRDLGFWRTPAQSWLMRRVEPWATGYLANSEAVRDAACRADGLDPRRFRVIPNGIDTGRYRFVDHAEPRPDVVIVGNLNRRVKRHDLFLEAAARLADRHPDVRWHLVGDGELRPEYERLAARLGVADRVVFAGHVDDVADYLERTGIGVNCSDSEGLSNAVIEYMLRGCAVVATAVGGNREMVRDGETGLLVPPGDATALAAAIDRLLTDPSRRRALARAADADARRRYDWNRCVADHERYYAEMIDAHAEEGRM